jgi:hypothetical protein
VFRKGWHSPIPRMPGRFGLATQLARRAGFFRQHARQISEIKTLAASAGHSTTPRHAVEQPREARQAEKAPRRRCVTPVSLAPSAPSAPPAALSDQTSTIRVPLDTL